MLNLLRASGVFRGLGFVGLLDFFEEAFGAFRV